MKKNSKLNLYPFISCKTPPNNGWIMFTNGQIEYRMLNYKSLISLFSYNRSLLINGR